MSIPRLKVGEYRVTSTRSIEGKPLYFIEGAAGIDPKTGATLVFRSSIAYDTKKNAVRDLKRGYF